MIVIKASGSTDVTKLRKLASALSAEELEIAAAEVEAATPRQKRGGKPTVSTLPGTSVSYETRAAMLELRQVDVEPAGEYELP